MVVPGGTALALYAAGNSSNSTGTSTTAHRLRKFAGGHHGGGLASRSTTSGPHRQNWATRDTLPNSLARNDLAVVTQNVPNQTGL